MKNFLLFALCYTVYFTASSQDCSEFERIKNEMEAVKRDFQKEKKQKKALESLKKEFKEQKEKICGDLSYKDYELYKDDGSLCAECDAYHKSKHKRNHEPYFTKYLREKKRKEEQERLRKQEGERKKKEQRREDNDNDDEENNENDNELIDAVKIDLCKQDLPQSGFTQVQAYDAVNDRMQNAVYKYFSGFGNSPSETQAKRNAEANIRASITSNLISEVQEAYKRLFKSDKESSSKMKETVDNVTTILSKMTITGLESMPGIKYCSQREGNGFRCTTALGLPAKDFNTLKSTVKNQVEVNLSAEEIKEFNELLDAAFPGSN